jgi:hypothetical protein
MMVGKIAKRQISAAIVSVVAKLADRSIDVHVYF